MTAWARQLKRHAGDRVGTWLHQIPLLPFILAGALSMSACADTTYAPQATPDVLDLRTKLLVTCLIVFLGWTGVFLLTLRQWGERKAEFVAALLAGGMRGSRIGEALVVVLLSSVLMFTPVGQFADWLLVNIYGWGSIGTIILVLASATAGFSGVRGIPAPGITLFGFVYPRLDLLVTLTLPALIAQVSEILFALFILLRR